MRVCYCNVGLHIECIDMTANDDGSYQCCCEKAEFVVENEHRAYKDNESVKDVLSTGRKRAAELFPITPGMACEWSRLLYAGGGPLPIIGCPGNIIGLDKGDSGIHHGPDKNTLNNEEGNVHRICKFCHNRWHTLNDQFYGKRPAAGEPFLPLFGGTLAPHDPETLATEEQIKTAEKWWETPEKMRGAYRV